MQNSVLNNGKKHDTMGEETVSALSKSDLERLERQLIALLNRARQGREELANMERQSIPLLHTVRLLQGKRPVIVPGEKRTHE